MQYFSFFRVLCEDTNEAETNDNNIEVSKNDDEDIFSDEDRPIAATIRSRRSQNKIAEKSKQTSNVLKNKQLLTTNAEAADVSDDEDEPIAVRSRRSRQTKTDEKSKHGNEEVTYNFGESEPEENNKNDDVSPQKNKSSLKRRRSSKFWEYIEIDEPEDELVNKQPTNNTTEYSDDDGDDKPIAAVRSSS